MTRRGRQMVWFLLFSFFPVLAFAITDEEIFRNFQFSFVNPGARSSGMGNAFVGLADDATAAEANPAGLTILTKPEVSFEYRHVTFDPDKLNSVNNIPSNIEEVQASSQNNLSPINQATFLSFVYPTKAFTFAFSRQGAVRLQGSINEVFHIIPGAGLTIDFKALGHEDEKVVNWNFSVARKLMKRLAAGATLRYSQLSWN